MALVYWSVDKISEAIFHAMQLNIVQSQQNGLGLTLHQKDYEFYNDAYFNEKTKNISGEHSRSVFFFYFLFFFE